MQGSRAPIRHGTWAALAIFTVVMVWVNWPRSYLTVASVTQMPPNRRIEAPDVLIPYTIHLGGWPFEFVHYEAEVPNGNVQILRWSWWALMLDGLVVIAIAVAFATINEIRHRLKSRKLQATVAELLIVMFLVSIPISWWQSKVNRSRRWRAQLQRIATNGGGFTAAAILPGWLGENDQWRHRQGWRQHFPMDAFQQPTMLLVPSGDRTIWRTLSKSRHLKTLVADGPIDQMADLSGLPGAVSIDSLSLEGETVTDADVDYISSLRRLRRLRLVNTSVSDVGISKLATNPLLEDLDLEGSPITDDCFQYLATFFQLRELNVSGTRVTGEGLTYLNSHPSLKQLMLADHRTVRNSKEYGVIKLENLAKLTSLSLPHRIQQLRLHNLDLITSLTPQFSNSAFFKRGSGNIVGSDWTNRHSYPNALFQPLLKARHVELQRLPSLTHLELDGRYLESLQILELPAVEYFRLDPAGREHVDRRSEVYEVRYQVADQIVKEIARLPSLRGINLSGAQMSATAWQHVADLPLTSVLLAATNVTDDDFARFVQLSNLTGLDLSYTDLTSIILRDLDKLGSLSTPL